MKKIMSIYLIIVLLMNFIPMNVIAATQQSYEVSDTINATLSSDGVLTISGSGEMPDYTERKLAPWNGENIKKVIVEKGITVIGNYAFYNMPSITEVELVEGLIEIGLSAFTNTSLKIVTIPASVTDIGTDAFVSTTIEEYKVAEGNPSFSTDKGALYEKIKDYTYMQYFPPKSDLTTYTIPDGVISISQNCFANAKNLQKINIPDSVTMIQAYAFANSGITSITIPEVILEVYSPNVFENCTELKTVNFYAEIDNVITNESKLPSGTFRNCTSLTEVNFKGVIEEFYANCFENCPSLKSIKLPEGTRTVNYYAFTNCPALEEVIWPSTIISVSEDAFINCDNLKNPYPEGYLLKDDGYYRKEDININITGEFKYDMAKEVLDIVNQERSAVGLEPLYMDEGLFEVAQQRAAELAVLFDHTRPNGSSYSSILPDYQGMNGENIAGSYTSAESVMKGWMNSSGHKRNILMSSFTSIGIGCFYHNNRYHWVQCFSSGGSKEMTTYPQNETKQVSIELLGGATTYSVRDEYKTVAVGEEKELKINGVHFDNDYPYPFYLDGDNFEWSSEDESILTVKEGKMVAKKPGKCVVNAITPDNTNLSVEVSVYDPDAKIKFESSTLTLVVGDEYTMKPIIETAYDYTDYEISWLSTHTGVVDVDDNGKLTAKKAGSCIIQAKLENGSFVQCRVTVKEPVPITSITLDATNLTITKGQTKTLKPTINPNNTTDDKTITWKSSNTNVATIDANGNITAKVSGKTTITATTTNGITATCEVEVVDYIKGDANNDGIINILDITYGYVKLEYDDITDEELERADVTGEGVYNISDINKMYLYLEGKIDNL